MTRPVMRPRDAALLWLESYMQTHPDGVWSRDAYAAGKAAGHSEKNVRMARATLGITVINASRAGSIWRIDIVGEER